MIRIATCVVASLAMAFIWGSASFMKALDPAAFSDQILKHHMSPAAWSTALAYVFITVEALLAIAHLTFFRPRITFVASAVLLVFFIGVTGVAWAQGNTEGCGCFGRLAARKPWEVILEDSGFLAVAALGFFLSPGLGKCRKATLAFASLSPLALALPFAGPHLPGDSLVTTFNPGEDLSNLAADDLTVSLDKGVVLLVLLSDSCAVCDAGLPRLEEIAAAGDSMAIPMPKIAAVFAGTRREAKAWALTHVPPFGVASAPVKVLRQYYRKLPQTALLENGVIRKVWRNGIPGPVGVSIAMQALPGVRQAMGLPDSLFDRLASPPYIR